MYGFNTDWIPTESLGSEEPLYVYSATQRAPSLSREYEGDSSDEGDSSTGAVAPNVIVSSSEELNFIEHRGRIMDILHNKPEGAKLKLKVKEKGHF